jgi:hypothetical protein
MVSFRKAFLLMALVVAFTTVAGAATATCTAFTSNVPNVRSEGVAEEVGQVVIECKGGDSAADPGLATTPTPLNTINVQVFLNTNVTSRRTIGNSGSGSDALEALLIIDDPIKNNTSAAKTCPAGSLCPAYAGGGGSQFGYKSSQHAAPGTGVNIFQGRLISNNSIIWTGVPFDAPGTTPVRTLRIVNVRANANGLGLGSTLLPSAIQMFISISGTAAPNLSNSQLVVAYIQRGLQFSIPSDQETSFLQCEPSDGSSAKVFRLRFRERFPTAFRHAPGVAPAGGSTEQSDLTKIYDTEHMYVNNNLDSVISSRAGRATQGTRLMAVFTGLTTNVLLRVPTKLTVVGTTVPGTDEAVLVQCVDASGNSCSNALVSGSNLDITPTGGSATVVYEVVSSVPQSQVTFEVPVTLRWGPISGGIAGPPGVTTTPATVAGSYAPLTSTFTARTDPAPRFVSDPADVVSFNINPCRTNLLFPYVTNQGGFDTGMAIANTSADRFGTVPQNGTCTVEYYGKTGASGAAPAPVTTESIPAGMVATASLANGGSYGIPAAKDFEGYIIARCNFQYAHGYAGIYQFSMVAGSIQSLGNYIALVLDADKDGVLTGSLNTTDSTIRLTPVLTRTGSRSEVRGN